MPSTKHSYLRPFIIITLGTLFYVYGFTLRIMPSAMTQELMRGFDIHAQTLGILVGLMYWGYTLMQIPSGLLYDRFNSRYILTVTAFICGVGTLLLGSSTNIYFAFLATFIMGVGEAFGFVGVLVLASRWLPPRYFAMVVGIVQLMGSVGAILGEGPIAYVVNQHGWRITILSLGFLGILLSTLIWAIVRDNPNHVAHTATHTGSTTLSEWGRLKQVIKKSQNLWIAFYAFCIWAPVLILAGLWLVPFLTILYNTSNTLAASAVSWVWVGIGLGSPFFGWWSDRIGRRCMPLMISALFSLIPALLVIYTPNLSWTAMNILLLLFGIGASGQALSFGLVQDNNSPEVAGTAVAFNNMAVVFGGVILQPLVGIVLHAKWAGSHASGIPVYSIHDYQQALVIAPLCSLLALIISLFFLKETHCQKIV